uniref:Glutamyl aminopeptidase n=1 Tax=Nothobranchius furzeri TaxID=105023 RepID=A0A1A8UDR2_NOTFU
MRDIMIVGDVLPVMVDDALISSHPIIVDVSSPAEITSVFDSISYSKGSSVLRMLEDWMGRDLFRDGCRKYLQDYQFKNAKTENFWASLAEVSGLPVAEVMDTWTKQMGYPVLDLVVSESNAILNQKRFLLDPSADASLPPSPFRYKWTVPVRWHTVKSNKNTITMFDKSSADHVISAYSLAADGLLKVNKDHIGFYRYLINESDYIVWNRVSSSIAYVRDMMSNNPQLYPKFQKLFGDLVKPVSAEVGWTDEGTQSQRLLRETVLSISCQMGNTDDLNEASRIFDEWISGTLSSVPVNLRLLVYRYGMKQSGTPEKWNIMFQRYKSSSLAQEKDKLLYGLASVENIQLLSKLLEATKDEAVVRTQDVFTVVRYVSYNPLGQSMAWDWATLNWDYLVNRFTINDRNLGRLLSDITSSYNTESQLWKMTNFFNLNSDAGAGEMPRRQALERVRNNIEWLKSNENEIRTWLESNVGPSRNL